VGSVMKMVHNRTNENSIVAKYTTKLNEKSKRLTESRNKTNTHQSHQVNRSRDTGLDQMPTIGEGSRGEESSSAIHSKNANNNDSDQQQRASISNGNNNEEDANGAEGKVTGVRMDGSFWRAGQ
jgi:hypothetical protein